MSSNEKTSEKATNTKKSIKKKIIASIVSLIVLLAAYLCASVFGFVPNFLEDSDELEAKIVEKVETVIDAKEAQKNDAAMTKEVVPDAAK